MLPDVRWSTDHLPDEVEVIELDPNDIIVSDRTPEEARDRLGETFDDTGDTIELQPIPVKSRGRNSDRSWTKQIDVSRAYILLCIAKGIDIKVERPTHLFTYKDTQRIPDDNDYRVWFATMYDLDENRQYKALMEKLKMEVKPDYIKRTWPGEITVDSNKETIWERTDYRTGETIETPDDAYDVAKDLFDPSWERERAGFIFMDDENNVVGKRILQEGQRKKVQHPSIRRINSLAEKYGADKIVHLHNHPSGTAQPSTTDEENYEKLKAGEMGLVEAELEPELWDKMVISNTPPNSFTDGHYNGYYSFRRSYDRTDLQHHISPPIKVEWTGKARDKVRHFAEHWLEKGYHEERSRHLIDVLDRESTNLVIKNTDEAEAFLTTLAADYERTMDGDRELHNTVFKFDGRLHQAGQRVRDAIIDELEKRGYTVEGSEVFHDYK